MLIYCLLYRYRDTDAKLMNLSKWPIIKDVDRTYFVSKREFEKYLSFHRYTIHLIKIYLDKLTVYMKYYTNAFNSCNQVDSPIRRYLVYIKIAKVHYG